MKKIKAKYSLLNEEFEILEEFYIWYYEMILVKANKKYSIWEKTSWIIIEKDIRKEYIKDLALLRNMIYKKMDAFIFFRWGDYVDKQIIDQKKKSWELLYI